MLKKANISLLFMCFLWLVSAQTKQQQRQITGFITDPTGQPIPFATVVAQKLSISAGTDEKGYFSLSVPTSDTVKIKLACLGYREKIIFVSHLGNPHKLQIEEESLRLNKVVVVARENTNISSSSLIDKKAIEHIQPMGLADVLQLQPGAITVNRNLTNKQQASLRNLSSSGGSEAMGTAIIIDGTPLTNDAALQQTIGDGIDLRSITVNDVESVEIIRGIPSAEYGDLTSGIIKVKTAKGRSPFAIKATTNFNTQMTSVQKGWELPTKAGGGSLNASGDHTQSYGSARVKSQKFNRITGRLRYANTFFDKKKPLRIDFSVAYNRLEDRYTPDPDRDSHERNYQTDNGIRTSFNGHWSVREAWLTNIRWAFSYSETHQESYTKKFNAGGASQIYILDSALNAGEYATPYVNPLYYSELWVDGRPISLTGSLIGTTVRLFGDVTGSLKYGLDYRENRNEGKGRMFDVLQPPQNISMRPRQFNQIPAARKLALFAETKWSIPAIRETHLDLRAGYRYTNVQPTSFWESDFEWVGEPRLNMEYNILNDRNNRLFSKLSLRGGYGMTVKTPPVPSLYPEKSYTDQVSFNYFSKYPENRLAVITTVVTKDASNPNLKSAVNTKREAGINLHINRFKLSATAFWEEMYNGIGTQDVYEWYTYRRYNEQPEGVKPVYENGEVYVDGQPVGYEVKTSRRSYSTPANTSVMKKRGVEFVLDCGRIEPLQTSLVIDGAYLYNKKQTNVKETERPYSPTHGNEYPYYGVYPAGKGDVKSRLSANFRFITHIPKVGIVATITAQTVWMTTSRYIYEVDGKHYPYRREGDNVWVTLPSHYVDFDNNWYPFLPEDVNDGVLHELVKYSNSVNYYDEEKSPFHAQFNLRLTKEFAGRSSFSFFANNLFDYHKVYETRFGSYTELNSTIRFGAELSIKM